MLIKTVAGFFLSVLAASLITATPLAALQQESPARALGKIRSIAETQHEIVMLLMEKKQYEEAAAEARKIFDMKWPEDQEPLLLKELLYLSDQFLRQGHSSISLRLLDTNMNVFKKIPSHVAIMKEKGYLYKSMNQTDKAIECFREAQSLEKKFPE